MDKHMLEILIGSGAVLVLAYLGISALLVGEYALAVVEGILCVLCVGAVIIGVKGE